MSDPVSDAKPRRGLSLKGKVASVFGGSVLRFGSTLVVTVAVTRVLSRADVGMYRGLRLVADTCLVCLLGFPQAYCYFLPQLAGRKRASFLAQTLAVQVLLAAACLVGLELFPGVASVFFRDPEVAERMARLLPFFAFFVFFYILFWHFQELLIATYNHHWVPIWQGVAGFLPIFTVVIPYAVVPSLEGCIFWMTVSYGACFAALVIFTFRLMPERPDPFDLEIFKKTIRFVYPLTGAILFYVLSVNTDKMIALSLFGEEKFGDYSYAALAGTLLLIIASSVTSAMKPTFTRLFTSGQVDGFLALWHRSIRLNSLLMLPGAVWLLLVSGPLIRLFLTAKFASAVLPFRVFVFTLFLQVTAWMPLAQSIGHTKAAFWQRTIIFLGIVFTIVGLWYTNLLGEYSSVSPAVGVVVGTNLGALYMMLTVKKKCGRTFLETIPVGQYLPILAVSAAAGLVALPARWLHVPAGCEAALGPTLFEYGGYAFEIACASLVFWAAYSALAIACRVVTMGELKSLCKWIFGVLERGGGLPSSGGR